MLAYVLMSIKISLLYKAKFRLSIMQRSLSAVNI